MISTFHHSEFADIDALIRAKAGRTISLCVPTLNEEDTIGDILRVLGAHLCGLLDEVVVIDSHSADRTREVAAAAGARVYPAAAILPEAGDVPGKGENIWKSLAVTSGDLLCFLDGDVRNMHPRFVLGTVGPLLTNASIHFVKGFYERPHAAAEIGERPAGGGRVTEALIRPLLSLFYPELSGLIQPLAGEYAVRRQVLEAIPIPTGYGVETALLLDISERWGVECMAQTDLDERVHRHQDTAALGRMGFAILHAFFERAARSGRISLRHPLPRTLKHFFRSDGVCQPKEWVCHDQERPPMSEYQRSGP